MSRVRSVIIHIFKEKIRKVAGDYCSVKDYRAVTVWLQQGEHNGKVFRHCSNSYPGAIASMLQTMPWPPADALIEEIQ